jgi:hypothetical protein
VFESVRWGTTRREYPEGKKEICEVVVEGERVAVRCKVTLVQTRLAYRLPQFDV